jgi:hypothetical protein
MVERGDAGQAWCGSPRSLPRTAARVSALIHVHGSRRCRPDPGNCWPPGTLPCQRLRLFIYWPACTAPALWLQPTMLRRLHRQGSEMGAGKLERKPSKRQRIAQFFKPKKLQPPNDDVPVRHMHPAMAQYAVLTAC